MAHGKFFIFSAPTGSGKSMLMKHAIELFPELVLPYSYTTRAQRPSEIENSHYRFISTEEFQKKIDAGEFLEWANYSGNYYGTLKSEVEAELARGRVLLKEVEAQGARQMRALLPKEALIVVSVDAGSWEELEKRVRARAPISEEELAKRKAHFEDEVAFMPEADVIIHNHADEHDSAKEQFAALIRAALEEAKTT